MIIANSNSPNGRYLPQHIANYFLDRADEERRNVDLLKLIKLVYIAYGWFIATTGERLYAEEIQAWKHGPVIPSVYHEFKHFKARDIDCRSTLFDLEEGEELVPRVSDQDGDAQLVLDKVWSAYKRYSGWTLRNKTHEADTPWSQVYREGMNVIIPDDIIREHFEQKIDRYLAEAVEG